MAEAALIEVTPAPSAPSEPALLELDPETAVAVLLRQAEILRMEAEIAVQAQSETDAAFRDMSPLGQRAL